MGLVAVEAHHTFLHMETVLTDLRLVSMAFTQAILGLDLYFAVRLVALKTLECGHRPADRQLMAPDASILRHHGRRFFCI